MKLSSLSHAVYFALNPQVAVVTPRAHGLDISKYDLFFFPETATRQLDFVIQRISYRTTRDEAFLKLVNGVMQAPIRGGYHYLNSDTPWRAQADAFIAYSAPYDYQFFACDFEGAYNVLSADFAYAAWQWIHYVKDKTGKPVFIYTSPSLYSAYITPSQARFGIDWNTVPLWTAQWFLIPNPNGTPSTPSGRTAGWRLWQYTDHGDGTLYGVARKTACDLDVYNGTVAEFRQWLNIGGEPIPPPDGGSRYVEVRSNVSSETRSIRNGHGIKFTKISSLPLGGVAKSHGLTDDTYIYPADVPESDKATYPTGYSAKADDQWIRVYEVNGGALPTASEHWMAVKHLGVVYTALTQVGTPDPPTEAVQLRIDVDMVDGKLIGTVSGVDRAGVSFSHTY